MKQKMFLTSCIAMGVVAPAVAAPSNTGEFPSSGLMQEDYTYTNAATAANMDSVYEGSVNATAQYDVIDYILSAGQYLPKDSDVKTTCPAGSYCAGGTFQYDEDSDQGLTSCSTATSGLYALSAAGASSQNDCYRTCTTSDVAHSATVTGEYYYGDNNQCGAASCVKGWHVKSVADTIGQVDGISNAYINNGGSFSENSASYGATHYGLTNNNTWATDYGDKGMLIGQGRCSTQSGTNNSYSWTNPTIKDTLTDETGQPGAKYCYCNVTGYKNASGTLQSLSSSWVFRDDYGDVGYCANACADDCARNVRFTGSDRLAFRAALLGSATTDAPVMCEATNYLLNAGQYLPADGETPTTCPAGYFCSGIGTVQYNQTSDQGIQSCPTGFGSSAAGASSANECYRTCTTSDVAHSTGVTGGYYYGDNNQCEPTGCVNGWHIKAGGVNLADKIGNKAGVNSAYISGNGSFVESNYDGLGTKGQIYYGLNSNEHNSWTVDYGNKGFLYGQGRCSTQQGNNNDWTWTNPTTKETSELGSEGGPYCYCNVTGYKDAGSNMRAVSSSWVFYSGGGVYGDASACADGCAFRCANAMRSAGSESLAFRAVLFNIIPSNPAVCEANTITINWSNADAEDISANNAGTATYGSDVRTPVKAETIKGKTFLGWKFSKPEQTPLP